MDTQEVVHTYGMHAVTRMNLEDTKLSEKSQSQKEKSHMIPLI